MKMSFQSYANETLFGPIYMVSGTQGNPSPSYLGELTFSPISLTGSTNRLHDQLVSEGQDNSGGGASCLTSVSRVALVGGTTFSHTNTLARLPGTIFAFRVSRNVCFLV